MDGKKEKGFRLILRYCKGADAKGEMRKAKRSEHIHAKKGAKLMIESIRARFPNVLNTNQPDVCNIILLLLLLSLLHPAAPPTQPSLGWVAFAASPACVASGST
jgi:hypothetical protein